jgi:demethoxyubiquinone hydroxylase (CLK1/Coq7/Cat5 family)
MVLLPRPFARAVGSGAVMPTFDQERQVRMRTETNKSVDALNELIRGEVSAVETYRQAIEKLGSSPTRFQLEACRRSHEQRIAMLCDQVMSLGGEPAKGSGAWGAFARLVEGGAAAFGERAAVGALEEGEDHGLKLYRNDLDKLDAMSRRLVEADLLPAQEQTHRAMSTLKQTLH